MPNVTLLQLLEHEVAQAGRQAAIRLLQERLRQSMNLGHRRRARHLGRRLRRLRKLWRL